MCQPRGGQTYSGRSGCACGCCGCGCGPSFRRFFSNKEEKECLEDYKEQLRRELAGVEDRIKELK
jgi:hypothetical protein